MNRNVTIATSLGQGTELDEAYYPSAYVQDLARRREVYWKTVVTFFATSVRQNRDARHVFCTNVAAIPPIRGFDTAGFLRELGVEIVSLPFTFQPPKGCSQMFGNAYFKYDALKHLARTMGENDVAMLFDCDCVWIGGAEPLEQCISEHGLLTYDIFLSPPPDRKIHNVSRRDMAETYRRMDPEFAVDDPIWFGGEILGGRKGDFTAFVAELDRIYDRLRGCTAATVPRFCNGHSVFDGDELLTTYICARLGHREGRAGEYIRRVFTSLLYRTVQADDVNLRLWHLPQEKMEGLARLYRQAIRPCSKFWCLEPGPEMARYLGTFFGIPKITAGKRLHEYASIACRWTEKIWAKKLRAHWRKIDAIESPG